MGSKFNKRQAESMKQIVDHAANHGSFEAEIDGDIYLITPVSMSIDIDSLLHGEVHYRKKSESGIHG